MREYDARSYLRAGFACVGILAVASGLFWLRQHPQRLRSAEDYEEDVALVTPELPRIVHSEIIGVGTGPKGLGPEADLVKMQVAAWAKVRSSWDRGNAPEVAVLDEAGNVWPSTVVWKGKLMLVTVPQGYDRAPKNLKLRVSNGNPLTGGFDEFALPRLPAPARRATLALNGNLPGVRVQQKGGFLLVSTPVPDGRIATISVVGSTWTDYPCRPENQSLARPIVKTLEGGSEPNGYYPELYYPKIRQTLLLKVQEWSPVRRQFECRFPALHTVSRFGEEWIDTGAVTAEGPRGVRFSLESSFPPPSRQPAEHAHHRIRISSDNGYFGSLRIKLLSPTSVERRPVTLEAGGFTMVSRSRPEVAPESDPTNGSFKGGFRLGFSGEFFEPARATVVAVDYSPPPAQSATTQPPLRKARPVPANF